MHVILNGFSDKGDQLRVRLNNFKFIIYYLPFDCPLHETLVVFQDEKMTAAALDLPQC